MVAVFAPGPLGSRPGQHSWRLRLLGAAVLLALVIAWELLPDIGVISRIVIAPPSAIVAAALTSAPVFAAGLVTTLTEIALAFLLASTLGLAAGTLVGSLAPLREAFVPVLEAAFAVPWVIVYPLLVAWFGLGIESKIIFGFVNGVFPVLLNTIAAISALDPGYRLLCRSLGASRRDTLFKVLARAALPGLVVGLRVGLALCIISVLVGEILTSTAGLGYLISTNETRFAIGHVYLGVVIALGIAWLGNHLIGLLERRASIPGATGSM